MLYIVHSGSVYRHISKNDWKETWLSLETDGKLTWKRKDAYQVKGEAHVYEILEQVSIVGWPAEKCMEIGTTPFLLRIPMRTQGKKSVKSLAVFNTGDLDLWLDAFATAVGKWKLWKEVKLRQVKLISEKKSMDEHNVERTLKYEELLDFFILSWREFLREHTRKDFAAENDDRSQNDITVLESTIPGSLTNYADWDYASVENSAEHHVQDEEKVTVAFVHRQQSNAISKQDGSIEVKNGTIAHDEKSFDEDENDVEVIHF